MAITTEDGLIAALVGGERFSFYKASLTAEGAGTWSSLWKVAGNPPAGSNPPASTAGSGYIPTRSTTGALPFSNPTTDAYLAKVAAQGATVGTLILYDRLWACSGFGTVSTSEQTITTPGTLTAARDPNNGLDVEPWLEVYTAPGATGATWTLKGTDANGTTNRTWTYTHPANAESVAQMMPLLPGGGSPAATLGCRVPTSFQASGTSGTVGDIGVTLLRRLAEIPLTLANVGSVLDAIALGLPYIADDVCLAMMVQASTTNTGVLLGNIVIAKD